MSEFWDNKFQKIGTNWSFEPTDSAIQTSKLFTENNLKTVLIPGVGFGRNARPFLETGIEVTGIEISKTASDLARENGLDFPIHHGSVLKMPLGKEKYDGIFCFALLHLFNQTDRRKIMQKCLDQLQDGGWMVFVVASDKNKLFGKGKFVSNNRFMIEKGLTVFFYDSVSIQKEFSPFGLVESREIDEPVKHIENEEPMKFWLVVCRKK
ncbi:MAG: class I SAM-dependent methyltransferase [Bacteroidota bacterium]|nr:class I SAM-dependent methyltransferase [Bacteroidota bacterium]